LPGSGAGACDPSACVDGSFEWYLADEAVSFTTAPSEQYTFVVDAYGMVVGGYDLLVECEECVAEGGSSVVMPGSPSCCPDLTPISCDGPDTDGTCVVCSGASICAKCGDSDCGIGENKCNCPADCPE